MRQARLIVTCVFLAGFGPFICDDADVAEARKQTLAGNGAGALEALAGVTTDAAEVHLARAVAHLAQKQPDEALEALSNAYRLVAGAEARGEPLENGPDLRRRIAFNRGLAQAQKEGWETAQAEFGKVLLLDPADDDARHNLELAWLKAHPPCPLREDDHEPDDTRKDAKPWDKEHGADRMLCPTNEDWYALEAPAKSLLYVTLKAEVKKEDGEDRAVKLELYAPADGPDQPSRQADVVGGQARVSYTGLPAGGSWAVRVHGDGKAEVKYSLEVELVPPCPADDTFEGKDTAESPYPLAEGEEPTLKACPGNPDWFAVTVPPKEGRKVTVAFDADRAPLDVHLYGPTFTEGELPIAVAPPGPNGGVLRLPAGEEERSFRVRVAASTPEENIYSLKVEKDEGGDGQDGQDPPPEDDEQKDDEKKDDEQKDDEKKDQQDPKDPQDQQAPKPPPPPDQVDIDQLIDSLDQHEKNPQLEKALRMLRTPPPRMEDY